MRSAGGLTGGVMGPNLVVAATPLLTRLRIAQPRHRLPCALGTEALSPRRATFQDRDRAEVDVELVADLIDGPRWKAVIARADPAPDARNVSGSVRITTRRYPRVWRSSLGALDLDADALEGFGQLTELRESGFEVLDDLCRDDAGRW